MSDQAPEAGTEQPQEQSAPQFDLTPVNERIDRLAATMDGFIQNQPAQQQETEDPYGGLDPQLLAALGVDPQEYAEQYQQQPDPHIDPAGLQQAIQSQIQQAISPYQQQVQAMQLESLASQLEQKYPELADPQVAGAVVEHTTRAAQSLAQSLGLPPEAAGQLRTHPQVIEMAYALHKMESQAVDEASAQPNHTTLENPSGAGPEGSEPSVTDRLLASRKGNSFWGV